MNKGKVVGYALIAIPIVVGIVILAILCGTVFLKAIGYTAAFIVPIVVGCHLLAKS